MRKLLEQIVKFGLVGVIATIIDYAILMFLSQVIGWDPVLSSGISFTISLVFNYLASMKYVFVRKEDMDRRKEFGFFVVLSLIGLALNQTCMAIGTSILGSGAIAVTINKVFATAIVMAWNFLSRKKWLEAK